MQLNALLEASAQTTNVVKWVSVAGIFVLFIVIALLCIRGDKHYDAKRLAFAGISLGLSFVLSFIKVEPVLYGGSVTAASFVPILIYTYVYGVTDGLLIGLIFGLFNFATSPYILTPMTFVLDYLLAFASIGAMGFAKKFTKKTTFNVVLGTIAVYVVRFIFHLISGFIYFSMDSIWVELPAWALSNAFIYSFIYQCIYIPADCAIAAVVMYVLAKAKVIDQLAALMKPGHKNRAAHAPESAAQAETAASDTEQK